MRHREAIEYLAELGSGSLGADIEAALASHVERCSVCRDWLATWELLAETFSRDPNEGVEHPDSDLLALCVVRPEEVDELDREELRIHLERCSVCREDLALARAAVREARPRGRNASAPPSRRLPVLRGRTGWMAAALVVLLLGGGLLLGVLLGGRLPPAGTRPDEGPRVAATSATPPEPVEDVSGRDLEGTQVIGGDRRLVVSKLTVLSGADVTFRAGKGVAFGDGFRVATGARLRVDSGRSGERAEESANENADRHHFGD